MTIEYVRTIPVGTRIKLSDWYSSEMSGMYPSSSIDKILFDGPVNFAGDAFGVVVYYKNGQIANIVVSEQDSEREDVLFS